MVVLIVVNQADIASTNQADALLGLVTWNPLSDVDGHRASSCKHVRMWWIPTGVLYEDHLDLRWEAATGENVDEVIFPSRHAAASGQASLTLHPIGVPHLESGERGKYGGVGGTAPPPNPRLAPWWRKLNRLATARSELSGFDLSLETTHHGPCLNSPSLFIEVGSTDATWGHLPAARLLAEIMVEGLGLIGDEVTSWNAESHAGQLVVVTLGGGHYAPRGNNLGLHEGVWLGHMLASYALPFVQTEGEPEGNWKQSIDAAISATREAFPEGYLVVSMDKKAFRGWQRQAIRDHLEVLDIPLLTTKQILARLETA